MGISNRVKALFFAFLVLFSFVGCKGGCNDANASTSPAVYSINFYDENLDFIETASKSKEDIVNSSSWYKAGEISPVTYQDITDDIRLYAAANVTEITNQEGLNSIRNALYGKYILLNDIDLNGSGAGFDNAMGWEPITGHGIFMGIFNGNSHKITNLWIDRASDDYVGLFGYVVNAQIRNLGVETADGKKIKGYKYVGGIAGHVTYGGITKSYSIGNVSGYEAVGGIAGKISESNITNAYSIGNISGDYYSVGGIAGHIETNSSITNAYFAGNINGHYEVGGITGYAVNSSVKNSATINPSVTGASHVNRAIGYIDGANDISNNFARSALTSGFDNFMDGNAYSGTGKDDGDFLLENTYKIGLGWDFTNIWSMENATINNGYPYLYWQEL